MLLSTTSSSPGNTNPNIYPHLFTVSGSNEQPGWTIKESSLSLRLMAMYDLAEKSRPTFLSDCTERNAASPNEVTSTSIQYCDCFSYFLPCDIS